MGLQIGRKTRKSECKAFGFTLAFVLLLLGLVAVALVAAVGLALWPMEINPPGYTSRKILIASM